jgi:hypothetical protein
MNPVVRGVLAVIAGMLVALVLIVVVQVIGTRVYPPPPMNRASIESIKAAIAQVPLVSLLFVLLSYTAGSVAGGWVVARFAPRDKMVHAMTLAGLLFCLGIVNLTSLPHPTWFWVASSAVYWLGAWSGAKAAEA